MTLHQLFAAKAAPTKQGLIVGAASAANVELKEICKVKLKQP